MAETVVPAKSTDSLWAIARRCDLPGGGAGWQQMSVQRGGTTYNLANQTLPGGLQAGDQVKIPQDVPHSCLTEVDQITSSIHNAPAAASSQGAKAQSAATANCQSASKIAPLSASQNDPLMHDGSWPDAV